jgi:DNA-binding Xre family transcriptional regulator
MRCNKAKKSMELADESLRGVVSLKAEPDKLRQSTDGAFHENLELEKLGRRIRRARKLLGFTQKGLSARCGIDRSYFEGVERGGRNVTFGVLCTICEALNCDIAAVTEGISTCRPL